jgi:hypothetical protein
MRVVAVWSGFIPHKRTDFPLFHVKQTGWVRYVSHASFYQGDDTLVASFREQPDELRKTRAVEIARQVIQQPRSLSGGRPNIDGPGGKLEQAHQDFRLTSGKRSGTTPLPKQKISPTWSFPRIAKFPFYLGILTQAIA